MSSITSSVQEYVASQPRFTWRRQLIRGLIRTLGFKVLWKMTITGLENIPPDGPTLLAMNHISLLDPILVMGAVTSRFVIPMSKAENMKNPALAPFLLMWGTYAINRGEVDRKALMNTIELLRSGQLVLIAPEGTRHPEGMTEAKDGMAYITAKAGSAIVPIGISGAVGWQQNMLRFRRTHIHVNFGRPFRLKPSTEGRIPREELAAMTHEMMYQIAAAVRDESLRGEYRDLDKATTHYIEFLKL